MERVNVWLEGGFTVKIFTARVSGEHAEEERTHIKHWLAKHGLPDLEITCIKDHDMLELYDDRAIQVIKNTGQLVEFSTRYKGA